MHSPVRWPPKHGEPMMDIGCSEPNISTSSVGVVRSAVAQPYLSALEELIASTLSGSPSLVCKHFFSGAALYSNTTICATLTPDGLAVKLPEERCSELIASGKASPLRYFNNSPIKRGYVLFRNASSLGNTAIASYLKECLAHANSRRA